MININQRIQNVRLEKGLTLEEVSKATKIKTSFLSAIESGEYEKLPSAAYAQGFVRNYIKFLGLPEKETLAFFRREFDTNKNYKVLPTGLHKGKYFSFSNLRIKQKAIIIALVFIALFSFIFYQYKDAIINPSLDIFSPSKEEIFSSSIISVAGKTEPGVTVFINGNPVVVEDNGAFKKSIVILSGKTTIEIKAVNHFNRETIVKREVKIESSP